MHGGITHDVFGLLGDPQAEQEFWQVVWENGKLATNKKPREVMEFYEIIGVSEGTPTRFVRVEMSANVIHGHPITEAEYKKLTKVH